MAQPKRRARFFVSTCGAVIERAAPLRQSEVRKIYETSDKCCQECGRPVILGMSWSDFVMAKSDFAPAQVDHIIPRSRGGQNNMENLRVLCWSCNGSKGAI